MKSLVYLFACLLVVMGGIALHPVMALGDGTDPRISLTATNQPLGEVLDNITGDTGYRFNLNSRWEDYPVSANIRNLPLEQGLKRLLRSLNYTIVWEADKVVTIMVYGKAEPGNTGPAVSFAPPPQEVPEEREPAAEAEPPAAETAGSADAPEPTAEAQAAAENEATQDRGDVNTQDASPDQEPVKEPAPTE